MTASWQIVSGYVVIAKLHFYRVVGIINSLKKNLMLGKC